MNSIILYFKYTHLSNLQLSSLRSLVTFWNGKLELISSRNLNNLSIPINFGKILIIKMEHSIFKFNMISELLSKFEVLNLLFINFNSFILSPSLYLLYISHKLSKISIHLLYGLSIPLNNLRVMLFKIRYLKITMNLLFQEKLLYKSNYKYIC